MSKKLLLIVNPCSGRSKMRGELLRVTEILSLGGYDVVVYPTKAQGDATKRVEAIKNKEFEKIVVCGGDGTLNEVITGMMSAKLDCTLGYIPAGTLNEWSTGLQISKNIPTAAKDVINGVPVRLDIGKFGDKHFCYTASFGAFTEASYSAPQDVKNVLGQAAYFFEGVKSLANIKPIHLKFVFDGKEIEGNFLFGAISNSMSVGGIVKFKEAMVKLNDGLFEVMLIRNPANISEFQSIVDGILRQDLSRNGIEFFHTSSLKVIGGEGVSWTLDGEYAEGLEEIEVKNIKQAVKFIVPNSLNVFE